MNSKLEWIEIDLNELKVVNLSIRKYSYLNVIQQSFNIDPGEREEAEAGSDVITDEDIDYILYGNETRCRIKKKIIFAKTHKTGSTTLQNILHRFGQVAALCNETEQLWIKKICELKIAVRA